MNVPAETIEDAELVSCNHCGVVFDLEVAHDHARCPVCDMSADRTSIPRYGRIYKWWQRV